VYIVRTVGLWAIRTRSSRQEFRPDLRCQSRWAIVWRCLRDPALSHSGTVPACGIQIDGQTEVHTKTAYTALALRCAVKITFEKA